MKPDFKIELQGVRQVHARLPVGWTWAGEPLACAQVHCQHGGAAHDSAECFYCPRFVGIRMGPGRQEVTVHCRWTGDDPVADLMTLAAGMVSVAPSTPLAVAEDLAVVQGIRHLPVIEDGELVGMLCRCDLVGSRSTDERVASRLGRPVVAIAPTATLREALEQMNQHGVGCLPVVGDGLLVGMLTRGDLRRVGFPEALLGSGHCVACGSTRGVRADPRGTCVEFCLECIERSQGADAELGSGD